MDSAVPLKRIETLPVVDDVTQYQATYPGYYTVPAYQTYSIPQHHDFPFAKQRKSIVQALGSIGHELATPWGEGMKTPHADIRETKAAYYIDVDFPGLDSKKNVTIKWINKNTLFVEAITKRAEIAEDDGKEGTVTWVHAGRPVGAYARAFSFPVDVEQDQTTAKLAFGTVRLTVTKKSAAPVKHKEVEVEHEGQ